MLGFEHESKIIAFDAIPVKRSHDDAPGVHKSFLGHLAVGISVSEVADLAGTYPLGLPCRGGRETINVNCAIGGDTSGRTRHARVWVPPRPKRAKTPR
jgi:hypothetical protein